MAEPLLVRSHLGQQHLIATSLPSLVPLARTLKASPNVDTGAFD
jgi:hypothetical protein